MLRVSKIYLAILNKTFDPNGLEEQEDAILKTFNPFRDFIFKK